MKRNTEGETMIEHHICYKEIDGYDKTVWMTMSEHVNLHNRLRKEGKCNIPPDELNKLSKLAYARTDKSKLSQIAYKKTKKPQQYQKKYSKQNLSTIMFIETMMPNVRFKEHIQYNYITGIVYYTANFYAHHGKKLLYYDIMNGDYV